ncbi:MAG: MFS transporter [Gammaproteobacteria bacterium]|nr:MAG: MFS transporter [Gammaproteobacteria bacterium]
MSVLNRLDRFNAAERRAVTVLGAVYGARMFGLFALLPVLALWAATLPGATPLWVGLAVGAYGLTQALFQIPFGRASDRFGRRPVIAFGLLLFAAGSLLAAAAEDVFGLLLGRLLQGAGAVSGAVLALAADLSRPEQRARVMALLGAVIGLAFVAAMVAGPPLYALLGGRGLFLMVGALALIALAALWCGLPSLPPPRPETGAAPWRALRWVGLFEPCLGVFCLHALLTACFVRMPQALVDVLGLAPAYHGAVYLAVMAASLPPVLALLRRNRAVPWRPAVAVLGAAPLVWWGWPQPVPWLIALLAFFTAFNLLEASLPAAVSRRVPARWRGAALGVYSTCQFLGAFAGGAGAGWALNLAGPAGVWALAIALAAAWLIIGAWTARRPGRYLLEPADGAPPDRVLAELRAVPGVLAARWQDELAAVGLEVDRRCFDERVVRRFQG